MLYTNIQILQEKINRLYVQSKPFFFVVNYEKTEGYLVENPLNQSEIFFDFPSGKNKPFQPITNKPFRFQVIANAPETYQRKFEKLQNHLQNGELSFANLTDKTEIETNLSLENIFSLSESIYQIYVPNRFVCFSPERFVLIADGKISTNPMKGTIDADIPNAAKTIIDDEKELAEHTYTVRLMTDELKAVSTDVQTVRFRYIDKLQTNRKNLLQVSSEIVGTLHENYKQNVGDTLFSLLPGTSIAGEPKQSALQILREIEEINRNYYCGIAGYFDGKTLDSAVLIRFIEQDGNRFYFRSGGGITAKSICENEYKEVLNKVYLPFA